MIVNKERTPNPYKMKNMRVINLADEREKIDHRTHLFRHRK